MGRDEEIEAIIERGRQTRRPVPRGLWFAAGAVVVICATGFVLLLLGDAAPAEPRIARPPPPAGSTSWRDGFGSGAVIGAGAGLAIGFALARQRRDHSSRSRP